MLTESQVGEQWFGSGLIVKVALNKKLGQVLGELRFGVSKRKNQE